MKCPLDIVELFEQVLSPLCMGEEVLSWKRKHLDPIFLIKQYCPIRLQKSHCSDAVLYEGDETTSHCALYSLLSMLSVGTSLKQYPQSMTTTSASLLNYSSFSATQLRNIGFDRSWSLTGIVYNNKDGLLNVLDELMKHNAHLNLRRIHQYENNNNNEENDDENDEENDENDWSSYRDILFKVETYSCINSCSFSFSQMNNFSLFFPNLKHLEFDTVGSFVRLYTEEGEETEEVDCKCLSNLVSLEKLVLNGTTMSGDLTSLSTLTNLTHFESCFTEFYISPKNCGDNLNNFSIFHNLKVIKLGQMCLRGDLESLSTLKKLQILHLKGEHTDSLGPGGDDSVMVAITSSLVMGDISALQGLVNLKELVLKGQEIYDDIDKADTPLPFSRIYGDFATLSPNKLLNTMSPCENRPIGLSKLKVLHLSHTRVTGVSMQLVGESFPSLETLEFVGMKFVVGLSSSSSSPHSATPSQVKRYHQSICTVKQCDGNENNINHLSNLKHLKQCKIFRLKIFGDISTISNLTSLEHLQLPKSQIVGNISVFAHFKQLKHLNVSGSYLEGNISCFQKLNKLNHIDLSHLVNLTGSGAYLLRRARSCPMGASSLVLKLVGCPLVDF